MIAKANKAAPEAKKKNVVPIAGAVGRRKKSVARAWLRRGNGKITVNGMPSEQYFDTAITRVNVAKAFEACPTGASYDVQINVRGGGKVGQSDAARLAIARVFVENDDTLRPVLRKHGLLTVDARVKERKKYGQKAARRKFQFVKR